MNTSRFFGQDSAFAEAGDLYMSRAFPQKVGMHANTLRVSRIAYCLGWCFAAALSHRQMEISQEELEYVAQHAISAGDWREFVNGFKTFSAVRPRDPGSA